MMVVHPTGSPLTWAGGRLTLNKVGWPLKMHDQERRTVSIQKHMNSGLGFFNHPVGILREME